MDKNRTMTVKTIPFCGRLIRVTIALPCFEEHLSDYWNQNLCNGFSFGNKQVLSVKCSFLLKNRNSNQSRV